MQPSQPEQGDESEWEAELLRRGIAGARVLLVRGLTLRAITVSTNLALIALVSPIEFGLLAVVRGTFELLQFLSELGLQVAMIRRRDDPTRAELAALAGLRTMLLAIVVIGALAVPSVRTLFGLIPGDLSGWMLAAIISLLVTPNQSLCRVRLERGLGYKRLSVAEVTGILLQNVALLLFALADRFREGIFAVQIGHSLYLTLALYLAHPIACISFRVRPLHGLWRDGVHFSLASLVGLAREALTPILLGTWFGLPTAGLWAFATRVGQFLAFTTEGYGRAGLVVTGRLSDSLAALRRFSSRLLEESASVSRPLAALICAGLPVVGLWFPRWAPAVPLAQLHIVALGVLTIVQGVLWLVAVARRGPTVALAHDTIWLGAFWAGLGLLRLAGGDNIAVAYAIGLACAVGYLVRVTDANARPELPTAFGRALLPLVSSVAILWLARVSGAGPALACVLASIIPALTLGQALIQRWSLESAALGVTGESV